MHRLSTLATFAVVAVALLTSGCKSEVYRAETVLKADGSVSRAIYQPIEATPDESLKPGKWSGSTYTRRVRHQQWTDKIADLPSEERSLNNNYFAAWGEFKSPDELPQAFVKKAPEGLPDGKLVVDYKREELGLVVAYRWQETLTDIVTIDDMHQAREKLADLLIPLGQKILDRALGEEYDTTKLFDWFQQTGQPWAFEMIDVLVARGGLREPTLEQIDLALAQICGRYGLVLTDSTGKLLSDAQCCEARVKYAEKVLRECLRRRDGGEVPATDIEKILQWMDMKDRLENSKEQLQEYEAYKAAAKAVVAENFGDDEKLSEVLQPLAARILGLYLSEPLDSHDFQYTLEVPGTIVKTNGTLLSEGIIRWTFAGSEAYPFGYAMECESLVAQTDFEKQLLGRSVLDTREAIIDYVELIRSDEELRGAMAACVAEKCTAPLYEGPKDRG